MRGWKEGIHCGQLDHTVLPLYPGEVGDLLDCLEPCLNGELLDQGCQHLWLDKLSGFSKPESLSVNGDKGHCHCSPASGEEVGE